MRFENRVVLGTGAAQGRERATAIAFAEEKINLALADLKEVSEIN